ncbi:sporulation histidine kinase inhibitor Sda [Robertmurraya massiliosenegalensis]|uniref:sporulation histidine kinase inhibitor Sda n=1 Tax=Robertmurraya massiliosenegalensis TaxID=1287657 RepID=UPI00030CF845|nr:sporulation histidine kinase inhibitor Sda [Robertmurraya massiliosenegalensis]
MFTGFKNEDIMRTYQLAVQLKLDQDFIQILKDEMEQRGLQVEENMGRNRVKK